MPSIFDFILGGQQAGATPPFNPNAPAGAPPASALDPFDPAEMRKSQLRDSLAGFGSALLAAGGPSSTPVDFGSALAKGIGGAAQGANSGEDKYLKRALVGAQVQKARSEIARDKALDDFFASAGGGATAPASPASAPTAQATVPAGGVNSNNIGNVRPVGGGASSGFQQPVSLDDGIRLAVDNVKSYPKAFNNGQPMTLVQIGQKWAPTGDGANNPTQWASNVASIGGLDPNVPLDLNDPATAAKFARGIHGAEHGPGKVLPVERYLQAIGGGQPPQTAQASMPGAGVPQGDAVPTGDPSGNPLQPAQYSPQPSPLAPVGAPPAPQGGPKTIQEVVQSIPEGVRKLAPGLSREGKIGLLMKYADPETHTAIDTTTGQVVFAPKNDRSGRYQPVDAMKLDLDRQRLEVDKRAAAAREKTADTGERNALIVPGPNGQSVTNLALPAAKGAVAGAEAGAKVAPALVQHQGELVIKDHQTAQQAAQNARSGMANLDRLGTLLEQVKTNKFQGSTQQLKASAKAMGVDLDAIGVGDNVGVAQAAQALSQQLALQLRDPSAGGGMPGAMSDADRQFLAQMVPSITNDPNANKLMIDWQKKVHQRTEQVGKIVNDYVRSPEFLKDPAGVYAKVREYADANPLFDPARDAPKAAAAAPAGMPAMNAIDAEIERRRKAGGK
jgi:hypothetical protein